MRSKYFSKIFVVIFVLFSFVNTFASTNTFERSEDNLRIHDSINVNVNNINNILNTPSVDENEKVYDFADLFSDDEESLIYNEINSFINKSNYDLAVVTINTNNKYDEVEYADADCNEEKLRIT